MWGFACSEQHAASGSGSHQASQVSQGNFVGFQSGKKAERTLPIEATFEEKTDVAAAIVGQVLARRSFHGVGFDQGIHQVGNGRFFDAESVEADKSAINGFWRGGAHVAEIISKMYRASRIFLRRNPDILSVNNFRPNAGVGKDFEQQAVLDVATDHVDFSDPIFQDSTSSTVVSLISSITT